MVGQHRGEGPAQPRRQPHRQLRPAHDRPDQTRGIGPGAAYVEKLLGAGKTRTEALRLLRRRLSDAVFAALRADEPPATVRCADEKDTSTDNELLAAA
ncbi:hypothetical protein LWC33_15705 [Pseudonocardia sp. RS11V-5]|uniref:hypothetical protein n=1 Tax=Pseudonocardia terrae TaxID=2905831 RepID=UPI001E37FA52|nr:hypothetical protein [Pseudonocardia terrae]MCE3552897.1 hypothetical protein [Pseudonocardia terrae]